MTMRFNKILIVNQPLNNRGDESAHKALVGSFLRFMPNINIDVLFIRCNQNSVNQYMVRDSRVSYINIHSLKGRYRALLYKLFLAIPSLFKFHPTIRKIIPIYKQNDLVLCAPGGICMGGFQNWEHISLLLLAKYLNKPVAYYGRSIGPFPNKTVLNRLFKKKSIELLHYFSFLSLRDQKSMELADLLNVKYEPTVDSAFLASDTVEIPKSILNLIGMKPYIVFVPNKLIWHYAYRGKVSLESVLFFYKKILDIMISNYSSHNIVMLPQTFDFDDENRGDINFFRDLKRYTQSKKLIIIPDMYSSDIQQTIISKADCMIGSRYHSVVFAINQAIPFVALSYEHKIQGLLETLHKTESMVDITLTFDSEENMKRTIEQFTYALSIANKDVNAQIKAKEMAKACFDKFKSFVDTLIHL